MTRRTRERLRYLIDQAKRRQIARAHGRATPAELRMWQDADLAEKREKRVIGRTYLERGLPVVVVTRWNGRGPRNVLIRRADDSLVVRPFRGLRKPS